MHLEPCDVRCVAGLFYCLGCMLLEALRRHGLGVPALLFAHRGFECLGVHHPAAVRITAAAQLAAEHTTKAGCVADSKPQGRVRKRCSGFGGLVRHSGLLAGNRKAALI
jgi:hypothetical protein